MLTGKQGVRVKWWHSGQVRTGTVLCWYFDGVCSMADVLDDNGARWDLQTEQLQPEGV
jgi:hypothetical protein